MSPKNESVHAVVIDDKSANIDVLSALLAAEGARVTSFLHPDDALAALPSLTDIDIVFCDLEMPSISGYDMLPRLRQSLGKGVQVIAYTVHLSEMDQVRRRGFDGFLGKPIDGEHFSDVFTRITRRQPVWEQP